jgi:mannose/fructose/N-acetylgalactosamine-specific phosphotransferase system component IIB
MYRMPIVLYRVDERLIHGQVVVGWGGPLKADRVVVVDDEIVASPWEQELYCLGVPAEIDAKFVSVAEARRSLDSWQTAPHRTILLFRNIQTLSSLAADRTLSGLEINLGGIHHGEGRQRVLPYLFLRHDERQELERIHREGDVRLIAQDLPSARSVPLDQLRLDQ